jgi:fumarylacetoacetase
LRVELNGKTVSEPPYRDMYWTPDQMLAHMTVNGASLRTGDLFASGTVSGVDDPGSFIELGRGFLDDGDTVIITATTNSGMSLGAVSGTIT